ncbi:MAG: ferrous iron transport protein A [Clostridiales bacterium]|nr:ferrous iron transport protein A [Clostridiales bacterium]
MFPLSMANHCNCVEICKISGKDETKRFIENLGFVPGEKVYVVHELGGNFIINVKGCRVAISKSMANKIMVLETAA